MAHLDNNSSSATPVSVRVDLTSQDLRTGIIRLPLQLHDRFPAGGLQATAADSGQTLSLTFSPPRELAGLQDFLNDQGLRTNDAVILHVDGQEIRLEPFYRRPRDAETAPATVTHQGLFGDVTVPAEPTELESTEADRHEPPVDPRTQPGLFEPNSGQPDGTEGAIAGAAEPDAAHATEIPAATEQIPHESDERASEAAAGQLADGVQQDSAFPESSDDFAASWDEDADADFADDTDFSAFTEAGPTSAEESAVTAAADTDPESVDPADDDLPAMPAWRPPTDTPAATPADRAQAEAAPVNQSPFHVVQRRAFSPRSRAQPRPVRMPSAAGAASSAAQPEPAQAKQDAPYSAAAGTAQQPELPANAPDGRSLRQQLLNHLDSPNLPSILQARQVAQELNLAEEDVVAELAELSQLPDSRLSSVRPGFYLLKRDRNS